MTNPSLTGATGRRPIEPSDLCKLRSVTDATVHPDGRTVVYGVGWPDLDTDSNRAQLYSVSIDGTDNRQLSHGHRDFAAVFSSDGTRLAFLRTEPKQPTSLMVMSWPLCEITEVARFVDGAGDLAWLDEDRLVLVASQRPDAQADVDDQELARRPRIITTLDYRFNARGYMDDRPRQIFAVPAATPDSERPGSQRPEPTTIGMAAIDHGSIAVSPDGRLVAATAATDDDRDLTGANHIWLYTVDRSADPVCLTEAGGSWASLCWHGDGRLIATGALDNGTVGFHKAHVIGLPDGGSIPNVQLLGDHDQHVAPSSMNGNGLTAVHGGILFPGVRAGRIAIDRYDVETAERTVIHEDAHQVVAFDAAADLSVVVAAITTTDRPAELWRVDGEPTKLVSLNDDLLDRLDIAPTEVVSVTSADGTEVQAFVVRPPSTASQDGQPRPGLVYVHGGPMFQYGLGFFDEFQMAAACGYVVIGGNPRGSDGYGESWAQAITGDLGNKDWQDVTAFAEHLAEIPEVDADRIGIGGGSYGGFMTSWALGHDTRYKAGLVERAVTSWNTMYGTSDIGTWFTELTIEATIEARPEEVTRQSPLTYAANITAPTLIIHSEEDWRCPIEQAEQFFAAIRRNGGTATLVRFPGENHELTRTGRPLHRIERFEIVHEFFAMHLGGADFGSNHLSPEARTYSHNPAME